jgi:signal transduction histidine kinase
MFFKQKRMADIRNDFLNNMTHELKTPISSVAIALEMIQDERHKLSDEKKRDYARIAQGELKRLTLLVEKVLKMAAFDKGEIQIKREHFQASSWLQDILASMRPVFETAGAQVNISVDPEALQLYADKTHITNILTNLVENALKYNDKPEPVINIAIGEEGNDTVLSVTDNGRGIPAAYVSKVLDKFFRVPAGDQHDIKGYGLGLSYVKAAVELHGGTIAVKSALGQGSTFTIHLPKNTTNA